ncbi:MAG: FG-GAP-like repeat-containing protein [Candidatus Latescibacterota bacterium]
MKPRGTVLATATALALSGPATGQTFFVDVTDSVFVGLPFQCRSVAWGDYDNDGRLDLFVGQAAVADAVPVALWRQVGGRFVDQSEALPARAFPSRRGGGSGWGDVDNDGDLDLFVASGACGPACGGTLSPNRLLRNDRGRFVEVTVAAALTESLFTDNAIWLDYDRDGLLDIYTGNQGCGRDQDADPSRHSIPMWNRLYRNQGDGTFADATRAAGLDMTLMGACGGSNGGMAAADFNDDGWPDLYLGVYGDRNRLFLGDGRGGFEDATTPEVADPGHAFDATVGDVDNDGDLDVLQAAGGAGGTTAEQIGRSPLLLNLGGGEFVDVTESAGLSALMEAEQQNVRFGDLDNDGDLDLLTGWPHHLFLNDGSGLFTEETARSGIAGEPGFMAVGDYDRDGFLDACFGLRGSGFGGLYRNQGNANHWLEAELAGVQSNRHGIGARVIATAGPLRQTREILGGLGYCQDEVMAHFGLGQSPAVDELEVRWPSGQVDVLTDVAADQRIRVIEGQAGYWVAQPTTVAWTDTLVAGAAADFALRVQPAPFDAGPRVSRVVADLSGIGGGLEVPLQPDGESGYSLRVALPPPATNQLAAVSVLVEQETRLGPQWSRVTRSVAILPAADLVVYGNGLAAGWQVGPVTAIEGLDLAAEPASAGGRAMAVPASAGSFGWSLRLVPAAPLAPFGYTFLHFAFHPGESVPPRRSRPLPVRLAESGPVDLLGAGYVDLGRREWQAVDIPLAAFGHLQAIEFVEFRGYTTGTFYLDDIRLVAARPSRPGTAVLEAGVVPVPRTFGLEPNYPNPFNGSTVIRFSLPVPGVMELAVYNLAGQRVATLVRGQRPAGTHAVTWDGRDGEGQPLATGVYLCHLRAGGQAGGLEDTRKVLLAR